MAYGPVLLVDDDPVFLRSTRKLLEERGMEVRIASDPAEGLALLQAMGPCCIVLGAPLEGGSGLDMVRAIRSRDPLSPIIMVPAESEIEDVVRAMRNGVTDYVKRPFLPQEIAARVETAFESMLDRCELDELKAIVRAGRNFPGALPQGQRWRAVWKLVEQVAGTDITVLITGESGTGKGLIARLLHAQSGRAAAPFVRVSCVLLRGKDLDKALFGFQNGVFVDRPPRVPGCFETAKEGTVFLDEISEMEAAVQGKFLLLLCGKRFRPAGMDETLALGCRVLASASRDLGALVEEGKFQRDLFHRLNVVNIHLPPLRECREDIPVLAGYFLERYSQMYGRMGLRLSSRLIGALVEHHWPGNLRELERWMRMLAATGDEDLVVAKLGNAARGLAGVPVGVGARQGVAVPRDAVRFRRRGAFGGDGEVPLPAEETSLKVVAKIAQRNAERELIEQALRRTRWNRRKAAQILGISYRALLAKIRECGLGGE